MSALVDDNPAGFRMPAEMQRHFVESDELCMLAPPQLVERTIYP